MPFQTQWFMILGLGFANVFYLFPYYRSLQETDTSVVVSLFSLCRIMIPVFAYLFVGEVLTVSQYVGFSIVAIASTALTFEPGRFRFNPSFIYMVLASLIIVIESVLYKAVFESGLNWGTALAGQNLISCLLAASLLAFPSSRRNIVSEWYAFKKSVPLFLAEESSTFLATAVGVFIISLVPLTFEKTVEAFSPIFVLLLSILFVRRYPEIFKEMINKRALIKKASLFLVMLFGVWLMV
jgi:drug/metabolite transporter (DMT)-like permease